jgi:large subunit ribosomal protein L15
MLQHELRSSPGARRARKRVGRGNAAGQGTYAGKGLKGQQARAGPGPRRGFEGGQTPSTRRFATRRGFRNPFGTSYQPVNLKRLAAWPAEREVTPEALREAGVVRTLHKPIKLLGDGEAPAALSVRVHRVSAATRGKIEAAGGAVEELTPRVGRKRQRKHAAKRKAPEATAAQAATTQELANERASEDEVQGDGSSESSESADAE